MTEATESPTPKTNITLFLVVSFILAAIGLATSFYSILHHLELKSYGITDFACNISQTFNCDDVARSKYSEVVGIPLGVWGFGYFLGMLILLIIPLVKPENQKVSLQTYGVLALSGLVVSIVLGAISYFAIGSLCVSCIGVYVVTVLQVVWCGSFLSIFELPLSRQALNKGMSAPFFALVVTIIGFNFIPAPDARRHPDAPESGPDQMSLLPDVQEIPINRSPYSGFGEDYRKGREDAKVTIVEFADFQCPACSDASEVLKQVQSIMGDSVQIVFKNYPLDQACNSSVSNQIHPYACRAGLLARCSGEFGKFWDYHDLAFTNQRSLSLETASKWAKEVGLTESQISECLGSKSKYLNEKIQDDISLGEKVGVSGTPTIFINGQKYMGQRDPGALMGVIQTLLNQ